VNLIDVCHNYSFLLGSRILFIEFLANSFEFIEVVIFCQQSSFDSEVEDGTMVDGDQSRNAEVFVSLVFIEPSD
jgi:hypothetical protein